MRTIQLTTVLFVTIFTCSILSANERTELQEKRTYFSKTYANEEGTYTSEISMNYIHYKDGDQFLDIDRNFRLVDTLGYNYSVNQGLYDVYFKDDLSRNFPVAFETKDKYRLRMKTIKVGYFNKETKEYQNLQNIRAAQGLVQGNKISFQNALNNVHIEYTYLETRLKEEIFVTQEAREQLPDPGVYGFDLNDTYLAFVTKLDFDDLKTSMLAHNSDSVFSVYEGEGRVDFKDFKHEIKYFLPLDVAYHAQEKDSLIRETEIKVRKRIYKHEGQWYLIAGVPLKWINNLIEGTIIIDPSIDINTDDTCQDAYVYKWEYNSSYADNNYGSSSALLAYAWTGSGYRTYWRSYLQFDFSVIPAGIRINTATLTLTNDGNPHGTGNPSRYTNADTYLRRVTEPWRESIITWNNQPASTTENQVSVSAPTGAYDSLEADVSDLIKDIVNSDDGNNGILLILQNESYYRGVRYASKDHSDPSRWPKLTIDYTEVQKAYYLKDHLGNIRVTLDEDGEVITADDYYPFGKRLSGRSFNLALTGNLYKFNSKELDEENGLNWYYFGARYYDPEIGRFLSVDRFADKYPSMSPYQYAANNPLIFIDVNGDSIIISDYMSNSEALAKYFSTEEEYKQLAQFAYEGQTITVAGQEFTFEGAGKYSASNINFVGSTNAAWAKTTPINSLFGKNFVSREGDQFYEVNVSGSYDLGDLMDDIFHEVQHVYMHESGEITGKITNNIINRHHGAMMQRGLWKSHARFIQQANKNYNAKINVDDVWESLWYQIGDRQVLQNVLNNKKVGY